jgi:multiple sugar transport system substrate-binding protein
MGNRMNRRQFVRLAGAMAAASALAACGATPTATPLPKPTATVATAAQPTQAPAAGPSAVTGTFRFHSPNETETRRPAVEKFFAKNYPKMTLQIEVTASNYWEKALAQIAAKDVPDMCYMHETRVQSFAYQGALMPIDDLMSSKPLIGDPARYPLAILKPSSTYKGKLYALAVGFAVLMLRYNKTMMEKAGVGLPSDQWQWDDLRNAAAKLTKDTNNDGTPDQWGWVGWDANPPTTWWPLMKSYGATHFNDERTACVINSDAGVQALDFMRSTWCGSLRSSPTPAAKGQLNTAAPLFESGLAAMDYVLSAGVLSAVNLINNKFEMGIELYPAGPKGRFVRAGGTSYAIPVGAKYPEIAWELMRYLAGDEEANQIAATYQTGNPLVYLDWILKYQIPAGAMGESMKRIVTDGFNKFGTVVQYAPIGTYQTIAGAALEKMAACEATAKQTADSIANDANKELKDLK